MVANTVLNIYQSIVAPSAAASASASTSSSSKPASGSKFSDLLNSISDRNVSRRDAATDRSNARANVSASTTTKDTKTNTAAKEDATTTAAALANADQPITPEDAADLLNNFDDISAQLSADGVDLTAQAEVKARLQAILDRGKPETISDILASLGIDMNASADAESATPEAPQIATQIISVLHNTGRKTCDTLHLTSNDAQGHVTPTVTANILSPALLALQAGIKPHETTAIDGALDTTLSSDIAVDANAETVVQITPLSAEFALVASNETTPIVTPDMHTKPPHGSSGEITAVPNMTLAANTAPLTATSAPTEAVIETPQAPDLDSLIPPLNNGEKKAEVLPDVTLPKVGGDVKAHATPQAAQPQAPATTAAPTFSQVLQATGGEGAVLKATKEGESLDTKTEAVTAIGSTPGLTGAGNITTQAVAPTAAVTAPNIIHHAPVTEQVSVAITRASKEGIDHITIQLSPDDMGRVEVKMQMHQDGRAQLQFTVDKAETFDAISRDARSLERSLQESGIKADTGSMQFNLRQQPQPHSNNGTGDGQFRQSSNGSANETASVKTAAAVTAPVTKHYTLNLRDGVDIHA